MLSHEDWEKTLIFHPEYENDLWIEASNVPVGLDDLNSYATSSLDPKTIESNRQNTEADIVTLGCSVTVGCGVNVDQVWSNQVAKKLNLKNYTIAKAGGSVQWSVNNFFSYVNYYKKPKIVIALFPDFLRMQIASRPELMIPMDYNNQPKGFEVENNTISKEDKIIRYKISPSKEYEVRQKYLKLPLHAKDHFPKETSFDISIQYIKMLEQYCNSNNILLIWSTWFPEQEQWLSLNIDKTIFKNYIPVDMRYWHAKKIDGRKEFMCENLISFYNDKQYYKNLLKKENMLLFSSYQESFCDPDSRCNSKNLCHLEFKDDPNFESASDSVENHRGHFSYHAHIHIAERFLKEIGKNENYTWNK